ncbi:MAG: hypothetical protein RL156_590 [Bacteroidota bacterium]|jgi:hypothetical protein
MKLFVMAIVTGILCWNSGMARPAMSSMSGILVDSIPRNLSPQNDTTFGCIPKTVVLRWSQGTSFDNSYFVELSADSTFENPIVSEVVVLNTKFECPVPQADTTLYWRIRTQFDTTAIWHFTLRRPGIPTTVSPTADTITDNPVKFVWNASSGGNQSEVLIEADAYSRRDTVTNDTVHYATLLGFKSYTWRVRTLCGDGFSEWSAPRTFYLNTVTNSVDAQALGGSPIGVEADPASQYLFVRHQEGVALGSIRVVSVLGHTVALADAAGASEATMDIRSLSSGVYFLVVESANRQWSSRVHITR